MMKRLVFGLLFLCSASFLPAQVGINSDNSQPDPSAMLDVKSGSQGLLVPRMTSVQRTGINPAATGLLVFQTDSPSGFYYYSGTAWCFLGNPEGGGGHLLDADGNDYPTVKIGSQEWMAENLRVTHYRNGEPIPLVTDNSSWNGITGAYCWYNNDPVSYQTPYGALYNWAAVNDPRNLCPAGWHVATDDDFTLLASYLGGAGTAGGKIKSALWFLPPNGGADNSSGFSGVPGGFRMWDGSYADITYRGNYWTSTLNGVSNAWYRSINFGDAQIERYDIGWDFGFSVRCVRNP